MEIFSNFIFKGLTKKFFVSVSRTLNNFMKAFSFFHSELRQYFYSYCVKGFATNFSHMAYHATVAKIILYTENFCDKVSECVKYFAKKFPNYIFCEACAT